MIPQKSKLHVQPELPRVRDLGEQILLIVDQNVLKQSREVRKLGKDVDAVYVVRAGETLKEVFAFPKHIQEILQLTESFARARLTIVTLGGGSVGDFGGFIASVLRRGVRLVHIPSTWLAAMDSAHGGKTALNVKGIKNCIGTFYPAADIYLVEEILRVQPMVRAQEAAGELAKMAMLDGGPWSRSLRKDRSELTKKLWKYLRPAVIAKYRVVDRDPLETKGVRTILNLGHTFGHVIEAGRGVPHGLAVAQGLYFAMKWSLQRDYLSLEAYFEMADFLNRSLNIPCWGEGRGSAWHPLSEREAIKHLVHDKKRVSREKFRFVFLEGWGRTRCENVTVSEMIKEAKRQGWVRK